MSGHSKWSTIKHKKAKVDAARGISFQKFSREIIMAAKLGGGDPAGNFRLRTAIERAKQAGLPNDNIKRAIDKGAGNGGADNFEEITYEGYANGGVAVFIEAMTDNRNRTAGFFKYNGFIYNKLLFLQDTLGSFGIIIVYNLIIKIEYIFKINS